MVCWAPCVAVVVLWQRGEYADPVLQLWCSRGLVGGGGEGVQLPALGARSPFLVCVFCSKVARRSHHSGCAIRKACPSPGTATSARVAPCHVLFVYIQLLPLTLSCSGHARVSVWAVGVLWRPILRGVSQS